MSDVFKHHSLLPGKAVPSTSKHGVAPAATPDDRGLESVKALDQHTVWPTRRLRSFLHSTKTASR